MTCIPTPHIPTLDLMLGWTAVAGFAFAAALTADLDTMALPAAILMVGAATCLPVMAAAQASALAGYSILASQQARVVAVGLSGAGVEAFVSQFFL